MSGDSSLRDWPEDFELENGNYYCTCVHCKQTFAGHKRRRICKLCSNPETQPKQAGVRPFQVTPIIGQEAITPKGMGRVTGYSDCFPHQFVRVCLYYLIHKGTFTPQPSQNVPQDFSPYNVTLVMPGSGALVKVMEAP